MQTFAYLLCFPGNDDFCTNKEIGVQPDPDDCRGFILCNAGKANRKKCAKDLLFNPRHLVCDRPARVQCRRGRKGRIGKAEKRGRLILQGKPAVEIVIQKEKMKSPHGAPNTEGIQAIRPNEENTEPEDGNTDTGAWTTSNYSREEQHQGFQSWVLNLR